MPAQDRVRSDETMPTQRSGQPPHERGEDGSVRPVQARSWVGAAQDGDFVAQHEELDVLGGGRPALSAGPVRAPAEGSNTTIAATRPDHAQPAIIVGQRPRTDFWHPTGSAAVRTRAAIVEAATVLFLRHGYQGTAVEDITRRRSCLTTTGHRSPLVSGGCGVLEPTRRGRCGGQRIGRQLALYVDRPSLPNRDREQEPCPRTTAHPVPHRPGPRSPLGHKCPGHPIANPPEARRARNSRLARSTSRSTR